MVILVASTAFWAGVLIVMLRRPVVPSRLDLTFVAYGLPIAFGTAAGIIAVI